MKKNGNAVSNRLAISVIRNIYDDDLAAIGTRIINNRTFSGVISGGLIYDIEAFWEHANGNFEESCEPSKPVADSLGTLELVLGLEAAAGNTFLHVLDWIEHDSQSRLRQVNWNEVQEVGFSNFRWSFLSSPLPIFLSVEESRIEKSYGFAVEVCDGDAWCFFFQR